MTDRIQIAAIGTSLVLLVLVIELVRRRQLSDEYAITWIGWGVALLVISVFRGMLDTIASWMGIYYPPALLLLALIGLVFVAALNFSLVLSRQKRQIDRLMEDVAVLLAEVRELRTERSRASREDATDQGH